MAISLVDRHKPMPSADPLSRTFAALADPTRRAILERLAQGEASVNELAAPFDMSLPSVSKHLKVLEGAGLISQSREQQWRPRRLEAKPLADIAKWLALYAQFWEGSLTKLAIHFNQKDTHHGKR